MKFQRMIFTGKKSHRIIFKIVLAGLILTGVNNVWLRILLKDADDKSGIKIERFKTESTDLSIEHAPNGQPIYIANAPLYIDNEVIGGRIEDGNRVGAFRTNAMKTSNFNLDGKSGIFCIYNDGRVAIMPLDSVAFIEKHSKEIRFAFQNGPVLVMDGEKKEFNHVFRRSRAGIGFTDKSELILVKSYEKVTMQDFAKEFIKLGCVGAIYLDGSNLVGYSADSKNIHYTVTNDFFDSMHRRINHALADKGLKFRVINLNETFIRNWDDNLAPLVFANKYFKNKALSQAPKLVFRERE
ncbi:MAG: phosphodiester glycosidase family protein [Alphaproteobacteria bacterium]|nr:phosphodiester glycosidase family protein [Alphaproteobacteria bacterium]